MIFCKVPPQARLGNEWFISYGQFTNSVPIGIRLSSEIIFAKTKEGIIYLKNRYGTLEEGYEYSDLELVAITLKATVL